MVAEPRSRPKLAGPLHACDLLIHMPRYPRSSRSAQCQIVRVRASGSEPPCPGLVSGPRVQVFMPGLHVRAPCPGPMSGPPRLGLRVWASVSGATWSCIRAECMVSRSLSRFLRTQGRSRLRSCGFAAASSSAFAPSAAHAWSVAPGRSRTPGLGAARSSRKPGDRVTRAGADSGGRTPGSVLETAAARRRAGGSGVLKGGRTVATTSTRVVSAPTRIVTVAPSGASRRTASRTSSATSPRAAARAPARAASTHRSCAPTIATTHSAAVSTSTRAGSATAVSAVTDPLAALRSLRDPGRVAQRSRRSLRQSRTSATRRRGSHAQQRIAGRLRRPASAPSG